MLKRTALSLAAGALFALFTGTSQAQDYRGRIQGTISDSSQAVIAGASVTLLNVNTGTAATRSANETGHYLFDLVEPGTYRVTVEAAGFSKFVQENIGLQTRADLTVDAILKTGSIQETVTVEGGAVAVQFNTSKLETTVDSVLTSRMPQYNRSPFLLAQLDPAVIPNMSNGDWNPYNSWGPTSQSVGGGADHTNDLQVDGSPTGVGVKNSYQPIMDSVEEVNIQQNAVDAEYGHSAGSAITMTTKSGTNEWHGLAYYQGQYPWANALENRIYRTPNLDRKNVYGGTLGNPILKNKLFNFVAFEGWKFTQPGSFVETVPTALERTGDFSQSLNGSGTQDTIYDPWSTTTDAQGNVTRTPFPGNVIPSGKIDPIAAKYSSLLWAPTSGGIGPNHLNNYAINLPVDYPYKNFSDRADFNVNQKLRVYGRVGIIRTPAATTNPTGSSVFQNDRGSVRNATQFTGNITYTLTPTTVLNVRGDYHGFVDASNFVQASGGPTFASLYPNANFYAPIYADPGIPKLVPRMSILDSSGYNQLVQMGAQNGWWKQTPNQESVAGQLSHQHNNHYIKGGVEWRLSQVTSALTGENPGFGFDAAPTSSTYSSPYNGPTNVSGNGYATFLLGAVATVNAGNQYCWACGSTSMPINIVPNTEDQYYGAFVNDDWKISRKLTLNLGLRYERTSAFYDAQNRMTAPLNLTTPNPIIQGVQMPAAVQQYYSGSWTLNGAYQFESSSHPAWNAGWGSLSPRAGIAYRLNDKTSLRAGFGRYYTPWEQIGSYGMEGANYYGFSVTSGAPSLVGGVPQMTLSNPFPSTYPLTQATGKSLGANTGLGDSVNFENPNRPLQHSDRINIGVQTELPGGIVADVTYFINFTNHACNWDFTGNCYTTKNINLMDPRLSFKYGNALNQAIPNPFYGLNMPGPLASQQFVSIASLMTPYPQYTGISEIDGITNGSNSHYQSLQIKLQKRFSKGYSFLGAYNYHREQDQAYYDSVAQYLNNFTWTDGGQPRQRLTLSGTWEVPLGKGRGYMNNANRLVDAALGGWNLTGLMSYQSGALIKFTNVTVTGNPGANIPAGAFFNPSAIQSLPAYTEETNPWYYPGVTGPHFFDLDASLVKDFHLTERFKFSLRMDAFNALNNANWAAPNLSPGNPDVDGRSTSLLNNTFGRQLQLGLRFSF
jgi:hypothetical protein